MWATHTLVKAGDMVSGEKYIITAVYSNNTYYLAPAAFSTGGGTASSYSTSLTDAAAWTFTKSGNVWTISTVVKVNNVNKTYYLSNTDTNNGVQSTEDSQTWSIAASSTGSNTVKITGGNSRNLALYQSSNWRCYSSSSGVQTIALYKVESTAPATITLNNYSGDESTSGYSVGQNFTLPSTNNYTCGTRTFVGWSTEEVTSNTKPTSNFYEPGESVTLAASNSFYAVFANASQGDPVWASTTLASLTSSDVFVFAVNVSGTYYAMPNNEGTSSAPDLTSITVSNNKITSTVTNSLKWNISGNATNGYVFYPDGSTTTWMYCNTNATSSSNDNIRVGTGTRKAWKVNNSGYLYNDDVTNGTRYLSRNGTSDFRSYLNTNTNPIVPVVFKYGSGTTYSNYTTTCSVAGQCATPGVTVAAGTYNVAKSVELTCGTDGATIYYTTDGSDPDDSKTEYTGTAITVDKTMTIKAIAIKDGLTNSEVASATYTLKCATPTITKDAEHFLDAVNVTLACETEGATIHYTLDGNDPTGESATYSAPFEISATTTVKAIAVKANWSNSEVASETLTKANIQTVAQALTAINALADNGEIANQYVSGVISQIDSYNSTYNSITYWISVDGTTTNQLKVYGGLAGVVKTAFGSKDDLSVGADVTIFGKLKKYVKNSTTTPEIDANSIILVYKPKAQLAWSAASYTAAMGSSNTFPTLTNTNSVAVTYSSENDEVATFTDDTDYSTLQLVAAGGPINITASFAGNETYKANAVSYVLTVEAAVERGNISFNVDGGVDIDLIPDATALPNPLPIPTKAGKNFDKWYTDAEKTIAAVAGAPVTEDITLYATWRDPYTVTEALAIIDALADNGTIEGQYVSGVISQVDSYNSTYHSITYWISADGTTTSQLEVYSGLIGNAATPLGKEAFDAADNLQVGDEVVVFGTLKKYVKDETTTPEFDKNNTIYSFNRSVVSVESVSLTENTAEVEVGSTVTLQASVVPANAANKTIVWSVQSGNDKASVDGGVVTGIAAGTAVIRAASDEDATIYAECTVTVVEPAPTGDFEELDGELVAGDYLIYEGGSLMLAEISSSRFAYDEQEPDANGIISNPSRYAVWTLAKDGDYWTFYNAKAGKYAAATGASGKAQLMDDLTGEDADKAKWAIDDDLVITNKYNTDNNVNATLRHNYNGTSNYGFASYSATQGGKPVFYKQATPSYYIAATLTGCTAAEGNPTKVLQTLTEDVVLKYNLTTGFVWPENVTVTVGGVALDPDEFDYLWDTDKTPAELTIAHAKVTGNIAIAITAIEKELNTITIPQTSTVKSAYETGDFFDPTGLQIQLNYLGNFDPEVVEYNDNTMAGFTFSPDLETALAPENTEVTITYAGKSVVQQITVTNPVPKTVVIIAEYDSKFYAMSNAVDNKACAAIEVTKDGDNLIVTSDENKAAIQWYMSKQGSNVKLQVSNNQGQYLSSTSSSGDLSLADNEVTWTMTKDGSDYLIAIGSDRALLYRTTGVFKHYSKNNLTNNNADEYFKISEIFEVAEGATNIEVVVPIVHEFGVEPDEAVAFGTVEVGETVAPKSFDVTLTNIASATVTLDGDDVFTIDVTSLDADGTITVTPNTENAGTYSATITLSDDAGVAEDKVINVTMTVIIPRKCDRGDDFNTNFKSPLALNSYTDRESKDGWSAVNTAVSTVNEVTYWIMQGNTNSVGVITSPEFNYGIGQLTLDYMYPFSESNGVSFKVEIKQNGNVVKTETITNAAATQNQVYTATIENINVEGKFQIVITNLSPSAKSSSKDRFGVGNICWANNPGVISATGGKFKINKYGDAAIFAHGNLQYQQSTNTWRTAPKQTDWCGVDANLQMGNTNYDGWVDLFCWSLGSTNNYGATSQYNPTLYKNSTFVDWGTLFASYGDWSTLTKDEFYYLIFTRPNASQKRSLGMVGDNFGLIFLPDEWTTPDGLSFNPDTWPTTNPEVDEDALDDSGDHFRMNPAHMPHNVYTEAEWAQMEDAGAVFLPNAGRRSGGVGNTYGRTGETGEEYNWTYNENYYAYYWTSTQSNADKGEASYLITLRALGGDEYDWQHYSFWGENGRYGQSIRLVNRIPRQYTVTYNANGATGTAPVDENTYLAGAKITVKGQGELVKNGYKFLGWKLGDNTYKAGDKVETPRSENDVEFIAQWEELTVVNSIAISGEIATTTGYMVGSHINPAGLTVTASVTVGDAAPTNVDVTNNEGLTWTHDPLVIGQTSVTLTATYEGQTATKTVTIEAVIDCPIAPIGGKFIINADQDTVVFSRGNMQYNYGEDKWVCASKQYEVLGKDANLNFGNPDYTGSVDLFSWSNTTTNYGLINSYKDADFNNNNAFVDWGQVFVGKSELSWRTLSKDECNYLKANNNWTIIELDSDVDPDNDWMLAMVLFPADWQAPAELANLNYKFYDFDNDEKAAQNTFKYSDWEKFENAGAVLLPATGSRAGFYGNTWNGSTDTGSKFNHVDLVEWYGYYWLSTPHPTDNNQAYYLILPGFSEGDPSTAEDDAWVAPAVWNREKRRGNAVRLVNVIPSVKYTLSYNAAGATGTVPAATTNNYVGKEVKVDADAQGAALVKDGYTFQGWYYNKHLYQANDIFEMPNKNVTLTARWRKDNISTTEEVGGETVTTVIADANISDLGYVDQDVIVVQSGTTLRADEPSTPKGLVVQEGAKYEAKEETITPKFEFAITLGSTNQASTATQVTDASNIKVMADGEIQYDITLGTSLAGVQADPTQWHAFTVPFPVNVLTGIYNAETDAKLTNEVDYAIMDYHGDVRAEGNYGWKKYRGTLVPGTFYIMTVTGEVKTFRFKKATSEEYELPEENSMAYTAYSGAGETTDQGWNGIGNLTWLNVTLASPVQVLDPYSYEYVTLPAGKVIPASTPFFYKASSNGSMVMAQSNNAAQKFGPRRAPATGINDVAIAFGNEEYTDNLYISASEDALDSYEHDKDLIKMRMSYAPKVAQIFGEAYNMQLSMVNAPLRNNQANYCLMLYAPTDGEYTISVPNAVEADIYLTYDNQIIWNIAAGPYNCELKAGNDNHYGLILRAKAPEVTTNVENAGSLINAGGVQKVFINDQLYILKGEKLYDVTGKMVK